MSFGYIVQAMFDGRNKALAGHVMVFMVQSNKYGPEYLESRMNLVLKDLASMKQPSHSQLTRLTK